MAASLRPVRPVLDRPAEIARLRAALKAQQYPAYVNPETGGAHCGDCGYYTAPGQSERHRPTCRTRMSKIALGELTAEDDA